MTEQEWLKCRDPQNMTTFLWKKDDDRKNQLFREYGNPYFGGRPTYRKAWLFVCASYRRSGDVNEHFSANDLEQLAEGQLGDHKRREIIESLGINSIPASLWKHPWEAANIVNVFRRWTKRSREGRIELFNRCELVRDIFGNPFRPITIDPHWQTSTVIDLACTIYDEKAFDRMPILADALMDAGCGSEEIIAHCQSGEHVRGCWAVDLLLGKK